MSATTFKIPGTHGGTESTLLVTLDYDAHGVTLCQPGCDYIDIGFKPYRQLLAALMSWVKPTDAQPPLGEPVLVVTKQGQMHTAARGEGDLWFGSLGGRINSSDVIGWALRPGFFLQP